MRQESAQIKLASLIRSLWPVTSGCRHVFFSLVLLANFATRAEDLSYGVVIDNSAAVVQSGKVSLYWYSWGGFENMAIGEIRAGQLRIQPFNQRLLSSVYSAFSIQPDASDEKKMRSIASLMGWFVVIEITDTTLTNSAAYYRSVDVALSYPESVTNTSSAENWLTSTIETEIDTVLKQMATLVTNSSPRQTFVLPPIVTRTLRFHDLNGQPVPDLPVHLSIFGTDQNHCGRHQGIELGERHTNAAGQVLLEQPRNTPLYFYGSHYAKAGGSYAGVERYNRRSGAVFDENDSVQARWEFESKNYVIRIIDHNGIPQPGVRLDGCLRTSGKANQCMSLGVCGASCGAFGVSNPEGILGFEISPEKRCVRGLSIANELLIPIAEPMLEELLGQGHVTIVLPTR